MQGVSSEFPLFLTDFIRIPELVINPLGDRIVHAFFRDCAHDCVDDRINFRQVSLRIPDPQIGKLSTL